MMFCITLFVVLRSDEESAMSLSRVHTNNLPGTSSSVSSETEESETITVGFIFVVTVAFYIKIDLCVTNAYARPCK